MKAIFYILVLSLFFLGCDKGPDTPPIPIKPDPPPILFPELHLTDSIKSMLPLAQLTNGAKAVYINQHGQEMILFISLEDSIKHTIVKWEYSDGHKDSLDYFAEYLSVGFNDTLTNCHPYITLSTQYGTTGNSVEILTAGLYGGSYFPIISIEKTGRVIFGDEVGSYELNGHYFQNVFTSMDHQPGLANYSRLYYNYDLGIVAFEGLNSNMWALDRYEN